MWSCKCIIIVAFYLLSVLPFCNYAFSNERFNDCIIITEQFENRLVIANVNTKEIIWEWQAKGTNVKPEHISWFDLPSEAKVVYGAEYVIMSASGGACALIRISDGKAMFYVNGGDNPHSIEVLPDGNIVCSSSEDNRLTVYKTDTTGYAGQSPHNTVFDRFSHNAVWDRKRELLWTGNMNHIVSWSYNFNCDNPKLTAVDSVLFDDIAGHDLFPVPERDALYFTSHEKLWIFEPETKEIVNIETGYDRIKSVSARFRNDTPILSFPKERWWTDEIFDIHGNSVFYLPGYRIYKARWIIENEFSYSSDFKLTLCK